MNPTPTNETVSNATASISSGFADSTGLGGVVIVILYIVGALLAAQFVAPWLAQSDLLKGAVGGLVGSLEYAMKGVAASAVLLAVALPGYLFVTADGSTRGVALEAVGLLLAGYVALVAIGALADRAVAAFIAAHPEFDSWGDIWETEDETETETETETPPDVEVADD